MRGLFLIITSLMLFSAPANALICEREKFTMLGHVNLKAAESWFPKRLVISDRKFKLNKGNPTQMISSRTAWTNNGSARFKQLFFLFPNGKLTSVKPKRSGFKSSGSAHYSCNKTSLELKEQLGIE